MNGDHLYASMEVDAEAGPSRHQDAIPEALTHTTTSSGDILYSVKLTPNLLPEIGRLAKEVIRGADEKIGIASGCYNSASDLFCVLQQLDVLRLISTVFRWIVIFDRWMQLCRRSKQRSTWAYKQEPCPRR